MEKCGAERTRGRKRKGNEKSRGDIRNAKQKNGKVRRRRKDGEKEREG